MKVYIIDYLVLFYSSFEMPTVVHLIYFNPLMNMLQLTVEKFGLHLIEERRIQIVPKIILNFFPVNVVNWGKYS